MQFRARHLALLSLLLAVACAPADDPAQGEALQTARADSAMNPIAEQYVKLVLAVGEHDDGYVDAYYGPDEWRTAVVQEAAPLDTLATRVDVLVDSLLALRLDGAAEIGRLRQQYLVRQLQAVGARVRMLQGAELSFDDESQALYDATAPTYPESHFRALVDSLDAILPGTGPVPARLATFKEDFVIPPERLDTVFRAAIAEARRRTAQHVELPANEDFVLEYVTDKPWSGYNWYQGNARSLIQINTDLPIFIDRAIDLAAHEGYPGHHVYNALLEKNLVDARGWPEYSVYPLYSPQSLIAEGSANYGIDVAFPGTERLIFERDVLFPIAGLDTARAGEYRRVQELAGRLSYAGNEAARMYLNGQIDGDSAAVWLTTYALMEPERAEQRVRFFDTYRSYVINYNYGRDLVAQWVEDQGGTVDAPERRWEVFTTLLSSPRLPSGLH